MMNWGMRNGDDGQTNDVAKDNEDDITDTPRHRHTRIVDVDDAERTTRST